MSFERDLNAVAWHDLYHAYGPATDVPEHIRALTSPDEAQRHAARYNLTNVLAHQGTRWEASCHALPFLIELVTNPHTPDRAQLMRSTLRIALGSSWPDTSTLPYPGDRFDAVRGLRAAEHHALAAKMYADPAGALREEDYAALADLAVVWERDAYLALVERAHDLLELTRDEALGRWAMSAIPWLPAVHAQAAAHLLALLRSEGSVETRATAALTLGFLPGVGLQDTALIAEHCLSDDAPARLQLAGAIALALVEGEALSGRALDVLIEADSWYGQMQTAADDIPYQPPLMSLRSRVLHGMGL